MFGKNAKEAMIREDLECLRDIGEVLVIIVRRVKLKDQKEAEDEKTCVFRFVGFGGRRAFLRMAKSSITTYST